MLCFKYYRVFLFLFCPGYFLIMGFLTDNYEWYLPTILSSRSSVGLNLSLYLCFNIVFDVGVTYLSCILVVRVPLCNIMWLWPSVCIMVRYDFCLFYLQDEPYHLCCSQTLFRGRNEPWVKHQCLPLTCLSPFLPCSYFPRTWCLMLEVQSSNYLEHPVP